MVFSAGIRPRDELARAGRAGGRRARRRSSWTTGMRTSDPAIYAIGECALRRAAWSTGWSGRASRWPRWPPTASSAARRPSPAPTRPPSSSCSAWRSPSSARMDGALDVTFMDPVSGVYQKLFVSDDAQTLLGGICVGDATPYARCAPFVGGPLPGAAGRLLFTGGPASRPDLPDDAQVCSCNNVTKGDGRARPSPSTACTDVPAIKACTRAGHHLRLLRADAQAAPGRSPGVEVVQGAVRALRATAGPSCSTSSGCAASRTFSQLIAEHGTGRGCDICKPAVASILASLRQRAHPRRRAGRAAGHQRPLPGQHPAQRHLLGGAAHPRRRDHPGQAHRDRRGGPRLRPLHQDHRRAADRPVRRPGGAAARRSGGGWSTPGSSPATPTARRCGR